jgi:hypothetical protein
MFASIRRFRCRPDQTREAMRRFDEMFVPRLEQMPGFVAYELVDCGNGGILSLTVCHDPEAAARSVVLSGEFVRDNLADIEIERIETLEGEVTVSRAVDELLQPAHI